jgi:CSLREA domain-containing protein
MLRFFFGSLAAFARALRGIAELHPAAISMTWKYSTWPRRLTSSRAARLLLAAVCAGGLALAALAAPAARAASIGVTTTADDTLVNGNCTLREAIIAANTDTAVDACPAGSGADTISLPAGTYTLAIAGTNEDAALTGDLDITKPLTLRGAGKGNSIIDAAGIDRVFQVTDGPTVIKGVRITGGSAGGTLGGGIFLDNGDLTLDDVRVTGNVGNVGGIRVDPFTSLTIVDSRLDSNAGASAGGLQISGSATVVIANSDISGNTSSVSYAGIANFGTLTLTNSTISGNSANQDGGGVYSSGTTSLYNVTIANNTADLTGSAGGDGGGIFVASGTFSAKNSIIGANFDNSSTGAVHPDCSGTLTSAGHNLIEDTAGCTITGVATGNLTGLAPLLDSLRNNGGRSFTQALQAGSPAINAGAPANGCTDQNNNLLGTDQRGFARSGRCDIGAYEANSPGPATATPTHTFTPTPTSTRPPVDGATATPVSDAPPPHTLSLPLILN